MARKLPTNGRKGGTLTLASSRPTPAPIGDNSGPHGEEAERDQLISIVSQLSAAEDAIELAKAPLKAAQKKRSTIIGLGKAAGFTAKELDRRLDEMRCGTRENAALVAREHKHRRWLGILEPDQAALILGDAAPQETKDEAHWKGEGYKAGLRQMAAKPVAECPERFVQAWLGEHSRGLKEVLTANTPRSMGVRAQGAVDFQSDNPDVLPEPGSAAAKRAERQAVKRAKESLDAMKAPANDGEWIEATKDELEAQTPRQAVHAIREADSEEPV